MTGPDNEALARMLQAGLDHELASVQADRRLIAEVLAQPVRRRPWRAWAGAGVAAAALGVAAVVVVPTLQPHQTVRLAGPGASSSPTAQPGPSPTATGPQTPQACPPQTSDAGGAVVRVDLDGDGAPDLLTWNGGAFHVILSGGHGEVTAAFTTASPYLTALPVSTAGTARRQVLIGTRGAISAQGSVGLVARLYDLQSCSFAPVPGANGKPYDFLVGDQSSTERSGVVCDGGVVYGRTAVLRGGVWEVTDTPVGSAGGTAVNGTPRTSTVADGSPEAAALATETCGGSPVSLG